MKTEKLQTFIVLVTEEREEKKYKIALRHKNNYIYLNYRYHLTQTYNTIYLL